MALHGKGDRRAGRDGVEPELIAQHIGVDDRLKVVTVALRP